MKAGELRDIIEKIERTENLNKVEISTKARVNRSYLSNLINEDEEKVVTDKMYRKFQAAFPAHFPKGNKTNKSVPRESNGKHTPASDLQTLARDLVEARIRHEAALNILMVTMAEFVAGKSGRGIAYEHSELQKAISVEGDRLRIEWQKQR